MGGEIALDHRPQRRVGIGVRQMMEELALHRHVARLGRGGEIIGHGHQ
jgi:hypothetical protein